MEHNPDEYDEWAYKDEWDKICDHVYYYRKAHSIIGEGFDELMNVEKYKLIGDYLIIRQRLYAPCPIPITNGDEVINQEVCLNTYYSIFDLNTKKLYSYYLYPEFLDECIKRGIEIF